MILLRKFRILLFATNPNGNWKIGFHTLNFKSYKIFRDKHFKIARDFKVVCRKKKVKTFSIVLFWFTNGSLSRFFLTYLENKIINKNWKHGNANKRFWLFAVLWCCLVSSWWYADVSIITSIHSSSLSVSTFVYLHK